MKISDLAALSLRNLGRRKGRTALTVVGIVLGTCLIVVLISLGIAQNQNYDKMLSEWGDLTQIQIWGGSSYTVMMNGNVVTENQPAQLNDEGIAAICALDHVVAATPQYNPYSLNGRIYAGKGDRYETNIYNIYGLYPEAMEPMGFTLQSGEWLSDDASYGKKVIPVLVGPYAGYNFEDTRRSYDSPKRYRWQGQTDANGNELPPFVDIEKDTLTLTLQSYEDENGNVKSKSWELKVVGVMNEDTAKGWWTQSGFVMRLKDLRMLEEEYRELTGDKSEARTNYDEVYVKVDDMDNVDAVTEALNDMGFTDTYSISDQREQMQAQVARNQMMLGGIAAISLLVAALNIANTMTMAIYERTREIGIMKVLGCELGTIRGQFLFESGTLGFLGGVIGCTIGLGISALLNHLTDILMWVQQTFGQNIDLYAILGDSAYYMGEDNILSVVPWWLLALALAFATVIGLVFGVIPANRAVKISALEAIRHD